MTLKDALDLLAYAGLLTLFGVIAVLAFVGMRAWWRDRR